MSQSAQTAQTGPERSDPPLDQGLSSVAAHRRLVEDGPNVLPAPRGRPVALRLLDQMTHFFAVLLWAAGGLAIIADLAQLGYTIFAVVLVNGLFAFAQEFRADRAADRLRDLLPAQVTVRRDGRLDLIEARDLVRGDVVVLAAGDRVCADLVLAEAHSLAIDSSMLSGESVPDVADTSDTLYAGTFVVEGEGTGYVTGTGSRTRLAHIAALTKQTRSKPTPLALELHRVVRTVAGIALGLGAGFFLVSVVIGSSLQDGFLFAIGVTVALVPEGLLPTVTLSLAIGAQRMAHRNALVRRLESVETLGSTTFICTDKTGTLTRNQMSVVRVWTPDGTGVIQGEGYQPDARISTEAEPGTPSGDRFRTALERLTRTAVLCSSGHATVKDGTWVAVGDPMEAAIDVLARRLGLDPVSTGPARPVLRRFPFDPRRRRASVLTGEQLALKGAPDAVLPQCVGLPAGVEEQLDRMTRDGLRVLAVATRPASAVSAADDATRAERELHLLGLLGLQDPPRLHVAASLATCRSAGISVAMITGDHPATARAIAEQVGLLGTDRLVLTGAELPADDAVLGALLDRDGVVVARAEPEDKLRIARVLQSRGHVVAMTGDGVNDGPALRQADVGIAMGASGTDVARQACDLVLLDDDFATIVAAIESGRATFGNIRKFLTYHLTDNVAELTPFVVWALSGGQFPLAIGVLQVLFLDLGTDLLPALALGAEQPSHTTLRKLPPERHLLDRRLLRRVFGVLGPVEALVEMTAFIAVMLAAGWRPGGPLPATEVLLGASGAAFAAVVVGQLGNVFACRSETRPAWQLRWRGNRLLLAAVATEFVALGVFLGIPAVAELLGHDVPPLIGAVIAALAAPAVLGADALDKWTRRGSFDSV